MVRAVLKWVLKEIDNMARPRMFAEPMSTAERMRRHRERKRRLEDVKRVAYMPPPLVTKPVSAVTKPQFDTAAARRTWIDVRAMIG